MTTNGCPDFELTKGDKVHGFLVDDVIPIESLRATVYLASHEASGARFLHVHTADPENLMAIALRTPPADNTGLPHILEHTVLCGSRRYPVRDPFVELLKTSLASFLNAMTYSDKTVYPCASMVKTDFYNLASVYCDAVFHPLIKKEHFKQEGHHFDFVKSGDSSSELTIKGIVYNEMKGAYSDLDGTIQRYCSASVCPDNAYGFDSGGDPEVIPELTYEMFLEFHRVYYHPSNSRIMFYGDLSPREHMRFLDTVCLSTFSRIEVDSSIQEQPRWTKPLAKTISYPVDEEGISEAKAAVVLTFLTNSICDVQTTMAMRLLDSILLGNAASPLRMALIDSKLGEELSHSGYDSSQRDTAFLVGLKGTEADRAVKIRDLVISTCDSLCREGLGQERIERALHQFELSSRSIPNQYPLHLMDEVYTSWLYDGDPCLNLRLSEQIEELKKTLQKNPRHLEEMLRKQIVDNTHYSLITFIPDSGLSTKKQNSFSALMKATKATLTPAELSAIATEAKILEAAQAEPNSTEALASLPRLSRNDIPLKSPDFTTESSLFCGTPFLHSDVFSNGINFLNLSFDLSSIDDELLDYLPLYSDVLQKMGAGRFNYIQMAEREEACCGIAVFVTSGGVMSDPSSSILTFSLTLKALDDKLVPAMDLLCDRLLTCDLTDRERLTDIILQSRIAWQGSVIRGGSSFAKLYAARGLSANAAIADRLYGVSQLRFYDRLATTIKENPESIMEKLIAIQATLKHSPRALISYVGPERNAGRVKELLTPLLPKTISDTESFGKYLTTPGPLHSTREGIYTSTDVAFVAQAAMTIGMSHPDAPALLLLSNHLSYSYLWEEIRVKGGAYGGSAGFDPINGIISLSSYRDPNILSTLDVFLHSADYILSKMDLSERAIDQAIIGTIKTLDRPIRPGSACATAAGRWLRGNDLPFREEFRRRLLSTSRESIERVASQFLSGSLQSAPVCVLADKDQLEMANTRLGEGKLKIEPLYSNRE